MGHTDNLRFGNQNTTLIKSNRKACDGYNQCSLGTIQHINRFNLRKHYDDDNDKVVNDSVVNNDVVSDDMTMSTATDLQSNQILTKITNSVHLKMQVTFTTKDYITVSNL